MAQPPSDAPAPSAGANRSHGRGGAGNMGPSDNKQSVHPEELSTPTIKSNTYTTGRGGQGNMVANDPSDPSSARAAQDVDAPRHHDREPSGTFHWGRGGEGNMMTVNAGKQQTQNGGAETVAKRTASKERPEGTRRGSSVLDRGREMLGLNKKPVEKNGGSAAVN